MTARGHTLVELLVALCLVALLTAGLLGLLGSVVGVLDRTRAALGAQRSLRRAQDQLQDDLLEAGFFLPCRRAGAEPRFLAGAADLTLTKDEVLPEPALLATAVRVAAPGLPQVVPAGERKLKLLPGDLVVVEDGRWEGARVVDRVELLPGRPAQVRLASLEGEGAPAFRHDHEPGAPVTLARPRRVHYRLAGPTLVRVETDPAGAVDWGELVRRGGPSVRIVAPGLTGFAVELPRGPGGGVPPLVRITLKAGPRQLTFLCAPRNGQGCPP